MGTGTDVPRCRSARRRPSGGQRARHRRRWAGAARELLEEAGIAAHVHPAPINVLLASYRRRSLVGSVLHRDVCFSAFIAAPAPVLIANNELTGLEWFDPRSQIGRAS